jgi:hypothetical protein
MLRLLPALYQTDKQSAAVRLQAFARNYLVRQRYKTRKQEVLDVLMQHPMARKYKLTQYT